jgi:hypothetical protein
MEQRFDFDENDSFLTRMRQRFDTYRVPLWQRPALLISGLNSEKRDDTAGGELPLIGAEDSAMREAPPNGTDGTLPQGGETSLFDAMGAPTPADGEVLTETGAPPVTRDQIAAQAGTETPAAAPGTKLLAPKTDPLASAEDDMSDGVMVKNGVKVIAENKVDAGTVADAGTDAPAAPADATLDAVTAPTVDEIAPPSDIAPPPAPAEETLPTPNAAPTATGEVKSAALAPPPVEETATASANVAPAAATPGDRYVQLGSIKEEGAVPAHWGKLQSKHGSLISGLSYRVVKAEIPDKGTFYRIQAGPIDSAKASDICGSLNGSSPGSCLVVKP